MIPHDIRQGKEGYRIPFQGERTSRGVVIFRYLLGPLPNCSRGVLWVAVLLSLCSNITAHEGPPFPIIVDKRVGLSIVSVWTDPDVGESTFFVIVNAQPGGTIPTDLNVQIGVQPTSGRLAEVLYPAQREDLRAQVQYKALVFLDAQEMWRVRVLLTSAQGSGEASTTVEATPPGYGRWDLLIYLLPFVAVALLWLRAVTRRRSPGKLHSADG